MRGFLLPALAAAVVLAGTLLGHRAEAAPLAAPSALGIGVANTTLIERAANVCGSNGCVRVQTARLRKHQIPHH